MTPRGPRHLARWLPPIVGLAAAWGPAGGWAAGASPEAAPGAPPAPYVAPYLPVNDAQPLQTVPSEADPAVGAMRRLRAALDSAPRNLAAALALANAYTDYSRQIGDAHYAGYAEAVLAPWMAAATPPAAVLLAQATILQYRHQFAAARDLLRRSLRLDPRNGQAWLTLATLDMVQGDYAAAGKGCARVSDNAGLDWGLACLGSLRSYTGQATQSIALLLQAQAMAVGASGATQAWLDGLIAESAERLGDWRLAESHYRAALGSAPRDNFLLVAYADFLLDRGRPAEVLALLADHEQSDTAFLRIALAQSALKHSEATRYTWIMAARFAALTLRGSDYFGREEARFALQLQHAPQTSLDMAKRNWQLQRAPWDARVLLEAALAANEPAEAVEVVDFVRATHLEDPPIAALLARLGARAGSGETP